MQRIQNLILLTKQEKETFYNLRTRFQSQNQKYEDRFLIIELKNKDFYLLEMLKNKR